MLRTSLRIVVFARPRTMLQPLRRLASTRAPETARNAKDDPVLVPERLMVLERDSVPEQRLLPARHGTSWTLIWHTVVHYLPMGTLIVAAIIVVVWQVYYKSFWDVTSEGWWGRHHVHMEPKEFLEPHKADEAEEAFRHAPGPPQWITDRFIAWANKALPVSPHEHKREHHPAHH